MNSNPDVMNQYAQQARLTAHEPPGMFPLTEDERLQLLSLLAEALTVTGTREGFDTLVTLMRKIRGEFP
jgi:hypothetical protein